MMKKEDFTRNMEDKLDFTFNGVDGIRREGLEDLKAFHRIKENALKKESKRLAEKLGTGHPRVKEINAKIRYTGEMIKDMDVLITEVNIEVEPVDKDTWKVHGKVVDKDKKGIEGLTVGLFNEKGKWQKEIEYDCTGSSGYFSITYSPGEKETKKVSSKTKLFLHVSDEKNNVLFREKKPLFVSPGEIDYRFISIAREGGVCPPPEFGPEDTQIMTTPDQWVVKGWVTDESGKGMGGYTVSLFDKDMVFDDYLGTTKTGPDGAFMLIYKTEGFQDLLEKNPDLYLKVYDKSGKTIYQSEKAVKCNVGHLEFFNIKIESKSKKG